MSLFWIFSGCDVKPHLAKAGPSGPRQCLPVLRLNTPRYSRHFWAGTEIPWQTKIRKNIYILQWQLEVWGHRGMRWKPPRQTRVVKGQNAKDQWTNAPGSCTLSGFDPAKPVRPLPLAAIAAKINLNNIVFSPFVLTKDRGYFGSVCNRVISRWKVLVKSKMFFIVDIFPL